MNNIDYNNQTALLSPDEKNEDQIPNNPTEHVPIKGESSVTSLNLKQLDDNKIKYTNANFPSQIFINQEYYKRFNVSKAKADFNIDGEISDLVELSFKNKRRELFLNKNNLPFLLYQYTVVEVEGGFDIGTVTSFGKCAESKLKLNYNDEQPTFSVVRHASLEDMERHKRNIDDIESVIRRSKEFIEKLDLDMKITDAEWQFDHQRLTIFFTAPQRIDFRQLVKDLARTFKTRIELRQISTREEAKRIGGMGSCGRVLCCASFGHDHCHVTLDHARIQQLSNNVAKLSGYCGRLKCCLLFEYATYVETFNKYPSLNSEITLPDGRAKILKADIFRELIYTYTPETSSYTTITFEEFLDLFNEGKVIPLSPGNSKVEEFRNIMQLPDEDDIEELKKLED